MNITIPAVLPPDDDQSHLLDALLASGLLLASTAVGLRIFFRVKAKNKLWLDDWLIIASEILLIVAFLVYTIVLSPFVGRHIYYVNQEELPSFFKGYLTLQLLYPLVIGLVKLSILAFYWRLFSIAFEIRVFVISLAVIVLIWMIVVAFVMLFQCHPIEGAWNLQLPGRQCLSYHKYYLGSAIPNISTDVVIMVIPIPYILRLHMRTDHRIGLIGTFMLGGFVIIVSIIRIVTILSEGYIQNDYTWNLFPIIKWAGAEMFTAVICACLPSMKPILNLLRTRQLFVTHASAKSQPDGTHQNRSFTLPIRRYQQRHIVWRQTVAGAKFDQGREDSMTEIINITQCEPGNQTQTQSENDGNFHQFEHEGPPIPLRELPRISSAQHQPVT